MSIPVIKGCPPLAGPWPVRCETSSGEVFVERRPTEKFKVYVNEHILATVDRWERGELVEVVELRSRPR